MSTDSILNSTTVSPAPDLLRGIAESDRDRVRRGRVLLAGSGNIGSWLVGMLAPVVGFIRVVDRARINSGHRANQLYADERAVGDFKADYLAHATMERFPNVTMEPRPIDLAHLPIEEFADVDVIAGGLHSLRGRQLLIADRTWPLEKPVVDGGVGAPLIGRVHVFVPGSACVECAWGPQHYRQLAAEYPCQPGADESVDPTPSPAFLGAMVAGVMAAEIVNILAGRIPEESREHHFDFFNRRFLTSKLRRARSCRFDHKVVRERIDLGVPYAQATVEDVLRCLSARFGAEPATLVLRAGLVLDSLYPGGIVSSAQLAPLSPLRLADLGFTPSDWIRVQTAEGEQSAFLRLANNDVNDSRSNS